MREVLDDDQCGICCNLSVHRPKLTRRRCPLKYGKSSETTCADHVLGTSRKCNMAFGNQVNLKNHPNDWRKEQAEFHQLSVPTRKQGYHLPLSRSFCRPSAHTCFSRAVQPYLYGYLAPSWLGLFQPRVPTMNRWTPTIKTSHPCAIIAVPS